MTLPLYLDGRDSIIKKILKQPEKLVGGGELTGKPEPHYAFAEVSLKAGTPPPPEFVGVFFFQF
jgi:hypothetical protein